MSTLSGNATKGEKGKKFQQIKIKLISTKSSEPEQQPNKSSVQRIQHGMTSLGKIPQARRPTNLPSEKSEQSGNDPSVNLVPSGGPGWGNKINETGATTTPSLVQNANPPTSVSVNNTSMPGTSQPAQHAQLYPPTSRMPPMPTVGHVSVHHGPPDAKTWARMALGGDSSAPNMFTPQSPLFHHEFPSLSSNAETSTTSTTQTATISQKPTTNTVADTQYGPGPSLRPQTGSWMGGSRPQGSMVPAAGSLPATAPAPVRPMTSYPPHIGPDGARNNLAPSGVGVVQGGPYPPPVLPDKIPPQYNALMPPFMLRNSYPGGFPPGVGPRPPYGPYMPSGQPGQHAAAERFMQPPTTGVNSAKRSYDEEDKMRSIIKDDDMSNIGNDIGWAGQEDIDYNQKLKFSDDEDDDKNKENQNKSRAKAQPPKIVDKPALKKETEKENDFRSSKESLKEREKLFPVENRSPEIRNVWQARSTVVTASAAAATRYQVTANSGRFGEDDEGLRERRKKMTDEIEVIIQRAKIRKEEEEKRYQEQLQHAANLKLKELNERILAERLMENKESNFTDRDVDMLPEWEKEKLRSQNRESQNGDESKKSQTPAPVPVVKDVSEFRALTQLGDRSTFVKKDREQANSNFSRPFSNNMPPRFQNLNIQNSGGPSSTGSNQSSDSRKISLSQFSSKSNSPNFGSNRHGRLDSDSLSDRDRNWNQEEIRKERFISDERPSERYSRENVHGRDFNYDRDDDRKFDKYVKDYENDSKRKFYEKGDYIGDSYREFERDNNYVGKMEKKNSESDRSDKAKDHDNRRYSENETHEKETNWRHEDSPEKSRHYVPPRSPRTFSENENHERKKSRDESYEKKPFSEKDREYYRKTGSREKIDSERDFEQERESFNDYKNVENDKRERENDRKEKDVYKEQGRKSPMTYEDRLSRSELRESRYPRESRESLRDESFTIQEERTYSWTDDTDIVEEKPILRREHFKEERGDRYSHAQRHPPGPITREKLEAKELESDKRNLTPLVKSDRKTEIKKLEVEDKKSKEKEETGTISTENSRAQKQGEAIKSAWIKDEKKERDENKASTSVAEAKVDIDIKEEKEGKSQTKSEESVTKGEDKKGDRKKSERVSKRDTRSNWGRHPVYRGNPYGSRLEQKLHRSARGPSSKTSRRDSKYSESEYSDEISGSGREDRISRNEREERSIKSKRYDRDDRGMDYRMDGYMSGNRGRNRDYYYGKPPQRGRGGFRASVGVGKRMDGYGPPPSKSPFGSGGYPEDRRQKSKDINNSHDTDKKDSHHDKHQESKSSRQNDDKNWKKYDNQDNKSSVSSPISVQTTEGNEESFATASEGTDSEDNGQVQKNKTGGSGTKRPPSVVVGKPQRRNYRSTSRKRFENRRSAPLYSRKDSGSYSSGKRNAAVTKNAIGNKENDKYSNDNSTENNYNKDVEPSKNVEKSRRDASDNHIKKSTKSRNQSNSRKNIRTNEVSNNRVKSSRDLPARSQNKQKKNGFDSKPSIDFKESKLEHVSLFKGPPIPAPPPAVNAWDKPITGALRTGSPSTNTSALAVSSASISNNSSTTITLTNAMPEKSANQVIEHEVQSASDVSTSTLTSEKVSPKMLENLDGSSPPVQTIIFENTNFKSGPNELNSKSKYNTQMKNHRYDKDMKLETLNSTDCAGVSNFNADSSSELPNNKHDPLQMALSFNKNEDGSDMKLDFAFDSEFSKLTEDNKSAKSMDMTHTMHMVQSSTAADLNFKIASVKKVWDGSLVEHFDDKYDSGIVSTSTTFSPSFSSHGSDPNNGTCYTHVETSAHVQVDDVSSLGHNEVVFSPVSQIQVNSNYGSSSNCQTMVIKNDATSSSSNVCKVKPQPQGCSANLGNVAQSTVMATLVSQPPPMSSPSYTFSCSTPQPNLTNNAVAATALAQMNFPVNAQYGNMPPVPSPPVLFNSSQAAAPAPAGVYQAFQIDNSQVAARSQYGAYTSYGLSGAMGQTSAFNQQSVFVQPPPSAPPPDMYSAPMPQFRLQPQPFGNTQQITSPSTVLISSTSNSLMSATIKPSNQQISAIGSKTGFPAAQTSPLYVPYDAATQLLNSSFVSSQLIQRPANNIMPVGSLPPSTSFYTSGTAAGQTSFFQPGNNSPLQPQPGTAIGLTAFNTQSATSSLGPANMPNYGSQLTQQYRSAPASYIKGAGNPCSISSDFGNGKAIALSNQHDPLNSVFPAGSQMNTNKARIQSGGKAVPTVQQAMAQHAMPQGSYNYQSSNQMRNNGGANKGSQYPHPIQRPVSQGNNSNRSGSNASNSSASHRMPVRNNSHQLVNNIQQQPPSSVYYTPSSGYNTGSNKLETSQLDTKAESSSDSKLADSIKTINTKNVTVSSSEKAAVNNE